VKKQLLLTGFLVLVFMLIAFPALESAALTTSYPYTQRDNSGGIITDKESSVPPQIEVTSASNDSSFTGEESNTEEATGLERYIIRLADLPLTFYTGGIAGIEATSPQADGKLDLTSSQAADYLNYLAGERSQVLSIMERLNGHTAKVIHEYSVALNGLALWLTEEEAATAAKLPGVASVKRDIDYKLDTDYSTKWIGAPDIWDGNSGNGTVGVNTMGEGIVIGVIDTGINPGNPSFADTGGDGYNHTNPRGHYYGVCDPDNPDYDPTFPCNDKLIGAYDFTSLGGAVDNIETPLDVVGHGSHTASTAAGNFFPSAVLEAPTIEFTEPVSGVAPHANIISYRACYSDEIGGGCPGAALYAAIEQAILDGVDVINYSIGDSASDPWDPDSYEAQGFLAARAAGIFVAASAGNNGPQGATVGSPSNAPWVLSVGASTDNRQIVNSLTQLTRDGGMPLPDIEGASITAGYGPAQIVYAGDYPNPNDPDGDPALCRKPYPPGTFHGEIVVGVRGGGIARVEKGYNVLQGGAGGFVLINDEASGDSLIADSHYLPAVNITYADGVALKDWLASGNNHMAAIAGSAMSASDENGDIMASFSSRGQNSPVPDVIKPDVSAPGVDILAAGGKLGEVTWYCWSGTSMASPHAAGSAALLKALHPDWSPAEIQSALMTTAITSVLKEDKSTPATPFDTGAGRIDVSKAARAGFVMDDNYVNYMTANPSLGGDPTTINLPSLSNDAVTSSCSWTRVLRSTMDVDVTWTATVVEPPGVTLSVSPSVFTLPARGLQLITVTADVSETPLNEWLFGQVTFTPSTSETVEAHFPVSIQTLASTLPNALQYKDAERNEVRTLDDLTSIYDITELTATYYGLSPADVFEESLYQDPTPGDPMDYTPAPEYGTFKVIRDVAPGTKRLVAEIVETTSLDIDMFIWNVSAGEYVCESATASPYEYCSLDNPDPGEYWVIVQNWKSSDPGGNSTDDVKLAVAEVPGNDSNNLSVTMSSGNTNVPYAGQPFNLNIEWNLREMARYWYGAFSLGSDSANAGNLGTVNLDLHVVADPIVVFPDANLDAAVRQTIDKPSGDIHQSDLDGLDMFEAESSGISDITGLEFCTNLIWLDLWDNNISDIAALSNLTSLFVLVLEDNQISDISPLSDLTNLWLLLLGGNQISDVSSLGNLTGIQLLILEDNLIENIAPLSTLTSLELLLLSNNQISDISPLGNLTGTALLFLDDNLIENIAPLSNLTSLEWLALSNNRISDISSLGNLTEMTLLFLSDNLISDIEPLSNMGSLQWLNLSANEIGNISTISTLTGLTALDLGYNQLIDIIPIANLTDLEWLDLSADDIGNISALSALTNLTALKLEDNQISDLTPLANLSMLEGLDLSSNDISDIAPLSTLTNLTDLDLGCSYMSDLDFQLNMNILGGLELQAMVSQITEMAFLPDSTGLTETHSGDEQTSDLGLISNLTNLIEQSFEDNQKASHDNPKADMASLPDFTNPTERHSGDKKTAHAEPSSSSVELIKESIDNERDVNTGGWMGNIVLPEGIASGTNEDSDGNQTSDIASELDLLDQLTRYVNGNQIGNLTPLVNLGNLTWLNLSDNEISDISPLGNLTGLVYLDLGGNQIGNVTFLGNLTSLEELYLWDNRINDVSPLGNLTNLTALYLWYNGISDISPLENLINLNTLHLAWNPIRDISPLSELTGLTKLRLGLTLIRDISPLGNLTELTDLGLSLTRISDISPLSGLTGLTNLRLTGDRITDISPLRDLTNLTSLRLGWNQIYDISPISGLTDLKELRLPGNQLCDISPISGLTGLTELRLSYNEITNISALSNLINLTDLRLNQNRITNIAPLSGLNNLTRLNLARNQISNISALSNLSELIYINLSNNELVDITGIENLTNLMDLAIWDNQISDISPLSNLTNLIYLDLDENQITDITALGNLTNLIQLALWDNQVSDISPLSNLANLIYLDLDENQISDITALENLTSLTVLYLWDNQISDISPLSILTNLTYLDMCENQIGNITALGNLTSLIGLDLCGNQISDTSPLASLTGLAYLDLCENQISDINAMGNLASLYNLYLCDNQISDILPLVQNNGLDEGDMVDLEENPLSSTSINEYIPQLEQRGVSVWWTVPPAPTPYFPPVYVPAAPTPTPEPTPVPTVEPCNWTGTWNTNWNTMVLVQTGGQVTGTYEYEGGRIVGVVSGNTLRGTWLEAPSYSPPDDGGDFVFTISSDCSSFTENWRYGSTGDWEKDEWNRVSSSITTPTPVPTPTPAPTPGPAGRVMDLSGIVSEDGQALHDINFVTSDGLVRLSIGEFAIIRTQDNKPLVYIGAEAYVGPSPDPLPEYHIISSVYEFVPDGATFEPSLAVTMSYNRTWLPERVAEEGLIIGYYDIATGQWTLLPSLVDIENNTVTAQINHFTKFAILGKEVTATAPLNVFLIIGPALGALIMIGVLLFILFAGKKRTRTAH